MILTPKQKAQELVDSFEDDLMECDTYFLEAAKKKCALITVNNMQLVMTSLWKVAGINENNRSSYLEEVKKEIEKL
jgi:hypothetical protein